MAFLLQLRIILGPKKVLSSVQTSLASAGLTFNNQRLSFHVVELTFLCLVIS